MDKRPRQGLGLLEHQILSNLRRFTDGASAAALFSFMSGDGYPGTSANLYITLPRLERKGLVRSSEGAPTKRVGGRRTRHYRITERGIDAVIAVDRANRLDR